MSNFLRQLVQRALTPAAPAIQPRLASHFENPSPARLATEHVETAAAGPASPVPAMAPPPAAAAAIPRADRAEVAPAPAPTMIPAIPPSSQVPSIALLGTPPAPALPVSPLFSRPSVPTAAPPQTPIVPAEPREPFPPLEPSTKTLLVERVTERVRELHHTSEIRTVSAAPAPRSPLAYISPIVPPLPTPISPAPLAATTTAPSPPAVRVTIGRIDIRAIYTPPAAAPVRAAAPRGPVVSLEEYLKQRAAS